MTYSKTFSIGEAARLCGVTRKQIRNWELKQYIPESTRVVCGERAYRNFGQDDLKIIKRIKHYLDAGYTLATAATKAAGDCKTRGGDANA